MQKIEQKTNMQSLIHLKTFKDFEGVFKKDSVGV